MSNDYNAILDEWKEEKRLKRAEASNFLNYSNCTFNWMRSTIQTGVQSLQEDGVAKKDLKIFLNETLEESWSEDYEKEFSEEVLKVLKQIREGICIVQNQNRDVESNLGDAMYNELEAFMEKYDLEDDL